MLLVTFFIILPLSLLRNLGKLIEVVFISTRVFVAGCLVTTMWGKKISSHVYVVATPPLAGYLGYTSGLSLLCMVFFLIVVSMFT